MLILWYSVIDQFPETLLKYEREKSMKIGLLEDNTNIHEYLKLALEMAGHTVCTHIEGMSLLDILFAEQNIQTPLPYDLLIIDLSLPGTLSGLSVINYIRQTLAPEALPIIVLSAASPSQLEQVHTRFPNVQVLQKPCAIKTLLHLIEASYAGERP
jgi:DNA-binding response OmpR family regulator